MSGWVTYVIVGLSLAGVIVRPFGVKEVWPALAGAAALVVTGQLSLPAALSGAAGGLDVYAFLAGMMLLAALADRSGVFAWVAAGVVRGARGSGRRLFALLFGVAVLVTVFLSNDATAVVLTPAVAAVAAAAGVRRPMPYFLICAFVANAASFVLPISNPANLVVYGSALPGLLAWLRLFALPSAVAIGLTFVALWVSQRRDLRQAVAPAAAVALSAEGRWALAALALAAAALMAASAVRLPLGPPTLAAGVIAAVIAQRARAAPLLALTRQVSWSTLLLVAALFMMVAALDRLGVATTLGTALRHAAASRPYLAPWAIGIGLGLGVNLVNNLPAGLLAGQALHGAPGVMKAAAMVGIDLGPNLSVTGSLATILWLLALREAGAEISALAFLRLGAAVMLPALLLAEAVLIWG